jgi:hypothetical protein
VLNIKNIIYINLYTIYKIFIIIIQISFVISVLLFQLKLLLSDISLNNIILFNGSEGNSPQDLSSFTDPGNPAEAEGGGSGDSGTSFSSGKATVDSSSGEDDNDSGSSLNSCECCGGNQEICNCDCSSSKMEDMEQLVHQVDPGCCSCGTAFYDKWCSVCGYVFCCECNSNNDSVDATEALNSKVTKWYDEVDEDTRAKPK